MQSDNAPKYKASNTTSYIMLGLIVAFLWLGIEEVNTGWFVAAIVTFVALTYERSVQRGIKILAMMFNKEKETE